MSLQQTLTLAKEVIASGLKLALYSALYRRRKHPYLYRAGFRFIAASLHAGVNPVALLMAIESQAKLTDYDRGAVAALQVNHAVVRALLKRHYG